MKRRVLLTGGSRGIGKAIKNLISNDFDVCAPSRGELDLLDDVSITKYLSNAQDFDVLVNNAGINIIKPVEEITPNDIRQINMLNLEAPLKLSQALIPFMKQNRYGRIVNIGSIWGVRSKEYRTLYSGTKAGLIGQTKALARELGEFNVLVNAVCPGFTDTDLTKASLTDEQRQYLESDIPLKRFAEPKEIANLVAFLIGESNTYITGQGILIDGGFTA